jgi:hypothetical protein
LTFSRSSLSVPSFGLRAKVLGAKMETPPRRLGLVADMLAMGLVRLAEEQNRFFVAGAACQPWRAHVVFSPIPSEQFAAFADPDRVKIAWTLEAEALEPALTRFTTETRAAATDDQARKKFRRYWRTFGIGALLIRRLLLPALRRQTECRWQLASPIVCAFECKSSRRRPGRGSWPMAHIRLI